MNDIASTANENDLHMFDVYGSEEEVLIAHNADDARAIMLKMVEPKDLEYACFDEYEDNKGYTRRDENNVPVTKTVAEWCKQEGRGYFASCYA